MKTSKTGNDGVRVHVVEDFSTGVGQSIVWWYKVTRSNKDEPGFARR